MKKWFTLTGYIVLVTFIFLYYLFPTKAVTAYVNYRLSDSLPGVHLTVAQMRPSFPPGLILTSLVVERNDKEWIKADQASIRPRYMTLFSQTKAFVLNGALDTGRVAGTATITTGTSLLNIDLSVDQFEIGNIPALKEMMPHSLTGIVKGKLAFENQPPFGKGNTDLTLSNCSVDFKPAFFGMNQLKMDTVAAKADLGDGMIKIEAFEVKGRELNGKATGTVTLKNPIAQSPLNISGQVTPTPTLMKSLGDILSITGLAEGNTNSTEIPFKISGTIESPKVSLR
jgi:type II secretion system protein N